MHAPLRVLCHLSIFPLSLGIECRCLYVGNYAYHDRRLEVLGDELRAVVGDDPGPLAGDALASPLDDRLDLGFGHALAELPVDDEPAVAVEEAAEVEEGAGDVDVRDVDVPVLVGPQGLVEARPLEGGRPRLAGQLAGGLEDKVDAGGADGHDVDVQHHVRRTSIALQGIEVVEVDDLLLLPILQPEIAGDATVVPVGCPQPLAPTVELAARHAQPVRQPSDRQFGALRPVGDELDDGIAGGLGNPGSVQSSPRSFFSLICSSMSSERTSCLRRSFSSR